MDFLSSFLGRSGYLPHGYCFTWTPDLLWSMVGADAVIAAAYFSIPVAIVSFARKRGSSPTNWVPWLFSAFIFACGLTHVMDIWTIWQPDYGLQAVSKVLTAAISIVTAVALWVLMPQALKIPSVQHLQVAIRSLKSEVQKRRTAEEHLLDSQQNLAVTLASIGAGFVATDREGHVTRLNAVAENLLGWSEEAALGQSFWTVFEREGRSAEDVKLNPVDVMIRDRVTVHTVFHVTAVSRAGGIRTPLEVKGALTHAPDGSVRGMALVFRDMSRLMHAEAEARRLAAIVESSNDAIIGKTLDGRITSWNGAAQAIFGYSAEEAVGQSVRMLIPPERELEEMRILSNLALGATVPAFETVRRRRDGRLLDVSVTISPIRDEQGRIVGGSKIARDISKQRQVELALRESEARLRFTLESSQIGDWDLDLVQGEMRRSLRHDRCFGYDVLLPHWSFDDLARHVHTEDRGEVVRSFQAAVEELKDWAVECRVLWPDASLHWIRLHGSIRHEGGKPTHMLGIIMDTTQQKLAETARLKTERLEAENRRIQEASRIKNQFLANMSHELRTPLNAIIGFADLLHSGAVREDSPKYHDFLGHIGTSGRHLLQLINDILDLSKVESGKFEFFPQPVQLPTLVREVCDILHTSSQRKRLLIGVDIDPALTDLVLDPARLKQVLYNYLSNAIKFARDGGHIKVRAMAEGEKHFRLEVEDDGIGIAPADLPRLFIEFQQLDSGYNKVHQGTGLGLSLTSRLVEAQGGRVGVRSTLGQGSVFHIVLPRVPLAQPQRTTSLGHSMLVIDYDWQDRARLVSGLSDAGFDVDAVSTGEQARQQAAHKPYDALMLGLLLPDQSGLGTLASIRSEGASRNAPVVGVTIPAAPGTTASFAIADVLSKPIRSDEIVAAMSRLRLQVPRARAMVIDDDPMALDLMRATLSGIGIDAICFHNGREALLSIDHHRPDAIILDLMMPEFDGFAVLDALRQLPSAQHIPVYIWTSMLLSDEEYEILARTARAIVSKGGGALAEVLDSLRRRRPALARFDQRSS